MCNTWQHPTDPNTELRPEDLDSLPHLRFANVTGGEPFLREDIGRFIEVLRTKADRIIVSTNGYLTDRIVSVAQRFPDVGFRISLEGLPSANDDLRGLQGGFDHGLRTLLKLREIGCKDIGFGITVSDRNADDLLEIAELADSTGMELATAVVHNSYYFHKYDNVIQDVSRVAGRFEELAERQLASREPKKWLRAWFNMGLANRVRGNPRLLPCGMGTDMFFVDPFGHIQPCNGMESSMGSLKDKTFDEIWNSQEARTARERVSHCDKQCWMVGSVVPAMKKQIHVPLKWLARSKLAGRPLPVCSCTEGEPDESVG